MSGGGFGRSAGGLTAGSTKGPSSGPTPVHAVAVQPSQGISGTQLALGGVSLLGILLAAWKAKLI